MKRFLRRHGPGSRRRLEEEGLEGSAVVRAVEKTMARENVEGGGRSSPVYEYQLEVTIPGREPYQVTHRQSGWPEPGHTVVVHVDQEDPEHLLIDWMATKLQEGPAPSPTGGIPAADIPMTAWMPGSTAAPAPPTPRDVASIVAAGSPASAKVVNTTRRAGTSPEGDPMHWFLLEVDTQDGTSTFLVEFEQGVPASATDRAAAGSELPVKVLAPDATGVAIDWAASETAG